jgi:uncharacterized protein (DUF362 family)/ferredoxin
MDSRVALLPCPAYDDVEAALARAMELAPPPEVRGATVLLKPNMLKGAAPEKAVSTHPAVVAAAARAFKARGAARVVVGDSPGYQNLETTAAECQLDRAALEAGAELGSFSEGLDADNPRGRLVKRFKLVREWAEADILVSLPKLKTHSLLRYTGAVKNLFGLVPGFDKAAFHFRFPDKAHFGLMLADLALCAGADYAIMDAVVGMEGPGPGSGYPRQVGLLLASANVLALDLTACRIIGYDPIEIGYLEEARASGEWLSPGQEPIILGMSLEQARVHGFKLLPESEGVGFQRHIPAPLRALARRFLVPRPVFNHRKCLRCSGCINICPAKALDYAPDPGNAAYGKRIAVDYKACIRCYCCHEVCPADAIRLRRL